MRTSTAAIAAAMMLAAGGAANAATVYADTVYIQPGTGQNTGDSQRFGPDNALGADDGDFYSLGREGGALFTFGGDILGPGMVVEVTFSCTSVTDDGTCGHYPETAQLFGITGPIDLTGLVTGSTGGVTTYDLGSLSREHIADIPNGSAQGGFSFDTGGKTYSGLFILDTSPSSSGDGFDVAAVSATPAPVPLPPAAALLFAGVGALGLAKRRKA